MFDWFSTWFLSLPEETRFFVAALLAVALFLQWRFTPKAALYGPTLLTTSGIFCTFLGIAMGLSRFDTANISQSVPELLAGLKTAFWASVIGVGGALSLKVRDYLWGVKDDPDQPREATVNDLNRNLSLLLGALSGPDGESLVSQIKLMRQDMNDKLDKLRVSQEKSLEALAEMGSKALIEALEGVIRDFNDKLTTQFGENFKKLNEAVHKMVEWQEGYRQHVQSTESAIKAATAALQTSMTVAEALLSKANEFSTTADKLAGVISALDKQLPVISQNTATLQKMLDDTARSIPVMKSQVEQFVSSLATSMSGAADSLVKSGETAVKNMQTANAEMTKGTTELANQIRAQSKALETEIEKALTVSITTLGQQLGTLSQQFAKDYEPITRGIRELLVSVRRGQAA